MKATHLLLALFIFLFSQFALADSNSESEWKIIPVKSTLTINPKKSVELEVIIGSVRI